MTPTDSAQRANLDRLVHGARLVLVGVVLAAVAIGSPVRPGASVLALAALGGHLAFGILLLVRAVRALQLGRAFARAELVADAALAGILLVATRGPATAALSVLVFIAVNAGLRRSSRAALITGVACVTAWSLAAVAGVIVDGTAALDLNRVVLSSLVLALASVAVVVLAVERDRLLSSLGGAAGWPLNDWDDLETALFALLCAAAERLPGSRVALVWPDVDEPWTHVAVLDDELALAQLPPAECDHLAPPAGDGPFTASRNDVGEWLVAGIGSVGVTEAGSSLLSDELLRHLAVGPKRIVGAPARGQLFSGHLLVLDPPTMSPDIVLRTEVVARHVGVSLDLWLLSQRAREGAVRDERARVWRDLHDGALQSLTGLALMLARAEALIDDDPAEARHVLIDAASLVHDEQRDLRLSILEQKGTAGSTRPPEDLPTFLTQLAQRFEQVWGMRVDVDVDTRIRVGPVFAVQITRMVQEALSNSARHGGSTAARLSVVESGQSLRVLVEDNGRGFPFVGTFDFQTLLEQRLGPVLLKDRVQRLHGTMDIRSASTGVGLDIRIPRHAGRLAG
ncbi:MAG TPA: histidine kinase [Gemmatimonadaceae bacterium]|nr:histidine kinase [Gemmatimonadaceae bacterium]